MTPLQIEIILHYFYSCVDYRNCDFSAPAVREAIDLCGEFGLLRETTEDQRSKLPVAGRSCYVLTERGRVYVEALKAVPLPIQKWVIPEAA